MMWALKGVLCRGALWMLAASIVLAGLGAQSAGADVGTITEYPIPGMATPYGIASGPDGNVWFTDSGNADGYSKVGHMTTSGAISGSDVVGLPGTPNQNGLATEIAPGPDGNLWLGHRGDVDKVPTTVTLPSQITEYPFSGGVQDLLAGPDNRIWLTSGSPLSAQIGAMATDGTPSNYSNPAWTNGTFGITVGPDNNLWVGLGDAIGVVDTSGAVVHTYPMPSANDANIRSLVLGPDGNVWFSLDSTSAGPGGVGKITPTGTVTIFNTPGIPGQGSLPWGLAVGPDNRIWYVDRNDDWIGAFATSARSAADVTTYPTNHSNTGLLSITRGSDGRMWFNEFNRNALGAITAGSASPPPPQTFNVSVSKPGSGSGTVTSSPAGIDCGATCSADFTSGTQVTLTAAASSGSTFAGWSGGGCSGSGSCTVTVNADTAPSATFNRTPPSTTPTTTTPPPPSTTTTTTAVGTVDVLPARGRVWVTPAHGARRLLRAGVALAPGAIIDTTRGAVRLDAFDPRRGFSSGTFYGGVFMLGRHRAGVTHLDLARGRFAGCRARAAGANAVAAPSTPIRHLWGAADSGFSTAGRDASAISHGAVWETIDTCGATREVVARGRIDVHVLVRSRRRTARISAPASTDEWTLRVGGGAQPWPLDRVDGLSGARSVTISASGALKRAAPGNPRQVSLSLISSPATANLIASLRRDRRRATALTLRLTDFSVHTQSIVRGTVMGLMTPSKGSKRILRTVLFTVRGPVVNSAPASLPPAPSPPSTGPVWAWGANDSYQLGYPTRGDSRTPGGTNILKGLWGSNPEIQAVAAGAASSLALLADGSVDLWSADPNAPGFGKWNITPPAATAISAGGWQSLVLDAEGHVSCFPATGLPAFLPCTYLEDGHLHQLSNVTAISAGGQHSLALLADGTVMAWGDNTSGQLGNGTYKDSATPVQVSGLSHVTAIAAGGDHSLALLADGSVMAWGDDTYGQLGRHYPQLYDPCGAATENVSTPAHVTLETLEKPDGTLPAAGSPPPKVIGIAAGGTHSLALLADGTVAAWGDNESGQLGAVFSGGAKHACAASPVRMIAPQVKSAVAIATTLNDSYALLSNGVLLGWGDDSRGQLGGGGQFNSPVLCDSGELYSKFSNFGVVGAHILGCGVKAIGGGCCANHALAIAPTEAQISPARVDFSTSSVSRTSFSFKNTGAGVVKVSGVTIDGDSDYQITSNTCAAAALPRGGSCYVDVFFVANQNGVRNATLSITSDASSSPNTAALTATVG